MTLAERIRTGRRDLAPDAAEVEPGIGLVGRRATTRRCAVMALSAVATAVLIVAGLLAAVTLDRDHPTSAGSQKATGDWRPTAEAPIAGRIGHSLVWTGREVMVWGGRGDDGAVDDGAAYLPSNDRWRELAPSPLTPREGHAAVWTGREALVAGGLSDGGGVFQDAAAYDPEADSWRPLARLPTPRAMGSALWTGHEFVILGGLGRGGVALHDGIAYDPEADSWRTLPDLFPNAEFCEIIVPSGGVTGATMPCVRDAVNGWPGLAGAVWTGREVLALENPWPDATGGVGGAALYSYSPGATAWKREADAPINAAAVNSDPNPSSARVRRVSVAWMGSALYVLAPRGGSVSGAVFSPETRSWQPLVSRVRGAVPEVPAAVAGHTVLFWDGRSGAAFDTATLAWRSLRTLPFQQREGAPGVWMDGEILYWGGRTLDRGDALPRVGYRYRLVLRTSRSADRG